MISCTVVISAKDSEKWLRNAPSLEKPRLYFYNVLPEARTLSFQEGDSSYDALFQYGCNYRAASENLKGVGGCFFVPYEPVLMSGWELSSWRPRSPVAPHWGCLRSCSTDWRGVNQPGLRQVPFECLLLSLAPRGRAACFNHQFTSRADRKCSNPVCISPVALGA